MSTMSFSIPGDIQGYIDCLLWISLAGLHYIHLSGFLESAINTCIVSTDTLLKDKATTRSDSKQPQVAEGFVEQQSRMRALPNVGGGLFEDNSTFDT